MVPVSQIIGFTPLHGRVDGQRLLIHVSATQDLVIDWSGDAPRAELQDRKER